MKKPLLLVIVVLVAAASVWSWKRGGGSTEAANEAANQVTHRLVADRIWIDHMPKSDRDTINVFVAVSEHAVGAFQETSQWRGSFEAFRYEANGGELRRRIGSLQSPQAFLDAVEEFFETHAARAAA